MNCIKVVRLKPDQPNQWPWASLAWSDRCFFFCVGAGKNRVWYISHTKVVLLHLEVLTLNNLFLAICTTLLVIKHLLFVLYRDGEEVYSSTVMSK